MSVAKLLGRASDGLLELVAPKLTVHAICGGYSTCCRVSGARVRKGTCRRDPNYGNCCTTCVLGSSEC